MADSSFKIDGGRIATADDDADLTATLWFVSTTQQRREGRRSARLGDDPQRLPKNLLGQPNCVVVDQHDTMHIILGDRETSLSDPSWCKRICRQAASFGIDRPSGLQRLAQRRCGERLDANDLDAA